MSSPYPFLSFPPPSIPLPSPPVPRARSNSAAIALWAARVQPGSPGTPSPRRRSCSRRPSLSRSRQPSISHHSRIPSASFINFVDTPSTNKTATPSVKDYTPDLLSLGYTTVFVPLPKQMPSSPKSQKPLSPLSISNIPIPPMPPSPHQQQLKSRSLKHFRSLSVLKPIRFRPRSKSTATDTTVPPSPRSPTKAGLKSRSKFKTRQQSRSTMAAAIAKHNKAKYASLRPAPLVNELELMQFMDGGRMDSHVKRVMEAQARAAAPSHGNDNAPLAVGDVFRDGLGGIWWDQEEEWEYAHLLGNDDDYDQDDHHDHDWVKFGDTKADKENGRRGSASTQNSELDARFVVKPSSEDDLACFGGTLPPLVLRKPVSSVLVRSRPRRATVTTMAAAAGGGASTTRRPLSPKSTSSRFLASGGTGAFVVPKKGKPRRRPAPLKLAPLSPAWKRPSNSPVDAEKVKKDFLDASFAPMPLAVPAVPPVPAISGPPMRPRNKSFATMLASEEVVTARKKPSNVWGLFRAVGGGGRKV